MSKPIVILGIFVADTAFRAARLPRMGETLMGDGFSLGPGGKGSNQAVAVAMAGSRAHFLTRVGADAFGAMARDIWARAGVLAEVIEDPEAPTGAAMVFVDTAGQNAIIVNPGAGGRISVADVEGARDLIEGAAVFITQLEQPLPAAERGLRIARDAGVRTILNPAPAADVPDAVLALCDVITPNETEAERLSGLPVTSVPEAEAAATALLARGAGAVLITLGEKGALYADRQQRFHEPGFRMDTVVDTTGAGDAFNAGFALAITEGMPIRAAVRFGCATAAVSVTRVGTAAAMPTRAEIDALLAARG